MAESAELVPSKGAPTSHAAWNTPALCSALASATVTLCGRDRLLRRSLTATSVCMPFAKSRGRYSCSFSSLSESGILHALVNLVVSLRRQKRLPWTREHVDTLKELRSEES
jgi:hypothetical protein